MRQKKGQAFGTFWVTSWCFMADAISMAINSHDHSVSRTSQGHKPIRAVKHGATVQKNPLSGLLFRWRRGSPPKTHLNVGFGDVVVNTLPHTPAQSIQSIVIYLPIRGMLPYPTTSIETPPRGGANRRCDCDGCRADILGGGAEPQMFLLNCHCIVNR